MHIWASQRTHEQRENATRVCTLPQLFAAIFIWRGQALTRHTSTHPLLPGLCHGPPRPDPVTLTRTHIWMFLLPLVAPSTHTHATVDPHIHCNYKHISTAKNGIYQSCIKDVKHVLVPAPSYWGIIRLRCAADGRIWKGGESVYHLITAPPPIF